MNHSRDQLVYSTSSTKPRPSAKTEASSLRADLPENAHGGVTSPAADKGQCDHDVLTYQYNMALTGDASLAPVMPTGASRRSADERQQERTSAPVPYNTDPDQPRSDLMKRTRSSLATEVRRTRRECAETRRKLREAQAHIKELEGARHA